MYVYVQIFVKGREIVNNILYLKDYKTQEDSSLGQHFLLRVQIWQEIMSSQNCITSEVITIAPIVASLSSTSLFTFLVHCAYLASSHWVPPHLHVAHFSHQYAPTPHRDASHPQPHNPTTLSTYLQIISISYHNYIIKSI